MMTTSSNQQQQQLQSIYSSVLNIILVQISPWAINLTYGHLDMDLENSCTSFRVLHFDSRIQIHVFLLLLLTYTFTCNL